MCGEKLCQWAPITSRGGSPPRMRGKAFCGAALWLPIRITPAYAGKRVAVESRSACVQDHPRVCGEKHCPRKKRLSWTGSPPRVRGKVRLRLTYYTPSGITPACAGKSRFQSRPRPVAGDHPRVCGEKAVSVFIRLLHTGSPPRVRGKAPFYTPANQSYGITPACAGKSLTTSTGARWTRDHPRVCGEKLQQAKLMNVIRGSPPRVRGKACAGC